MIKPNKIDDLATRLANAIPDELISAKQRLQKIFFSILQSSMSKMDLVTREEFDVQAKILARTREKLHTLEQHVANKEKSD